MHFEFNFYSSLLLVFFVHGLVYAILLYRKSLVKKNAADKWLSLFLLLGILYIAPWMLGFAGWYDQQTYRDFLLYTPLQQLYLLGPVLFIYVQSLLNPLFRFGKHQWLHLLPGWCYLGYGVVMVVADKIFLKKYYFLQDGLDRDFDFWYQITGFTSITIYFFASLRYYVVYKKLMAQVVSYADTLSFSWMKNFLVAFLFILGLQLFFYLLTALFPEANSYVGSWWYYFSFALILYYIAITGYANSIKTTIAFTPNLFTAPPTLWLTPNPLVPFHQNDAEEAVKVEIAITTPGSRTTALPLDPAIEPWKEKILTLMETENLYTNPELSLTQLAKQVHSNPAFVSKVINQGFGMNFNDFVNHYRVRAVQRCLQAGQHKTHTLLAIAYECGFNSKATFNRAFKKYTGQIPQEYVKLRAGLT
ncbi:helix-turn-helix domain-containing protein [Adhaeribacter pallidiroseus]|uniref:HTH araC/xylS-type domain-containing protein n=1 Tax=Adhaeribacter pallidiroseus TaxID=2072847 RepID=A0A369QMM9_9BACT|nr:AraC family transcriptional regulator [Adhaeribacter pallidiroseus]RDC65612.1 hypothetical protein AHMF7616_04242 [Adhaeribacter pallidiroseus]